MSSATLTIKAQLALLAGYLNLKLPDELLLLYAADLEDLGPQGVSMAIDALKRDESLWPGRFPLPAKIRSYLTGSVEDRAVMSAKKILSIGSYAEAKEKLSNLEHLVFYEYGPRAIMDRDVSQTPAMFAQLREMMRATINHNTISQVKVAHELRQDPRSYLAQASGPEDAPCAATERAYVQAELDP